MSKELPPLEALNFIKKNYFPMNKFIHKDFEIVETTLKDYVVKQEFFDNTMPILFKHKIKDHEELDMLLKALEIIKEKGCLQFCVIGVSLEDYNNSVDITNKDYGLERYKHYNQKEFDLVKEVLL